MKELVEKIKKDVEYMESTHVNDPKIDVLLDEIEQVLLKKPSVTIELLNQLDLVSIEWICSRFEKVSYELQSKEFIDCLDGLIDKFSPNINGFKNEVIEAKEAYQALQIKNIFIKAQLDLIEVLKPPKILDGFFYVKSYSEFSITPLN